MHDIVPRRPTRKNNAEASDDNTSDGRATDNVQLSVDDGAVAAVSDEIKPADAAGPSNVELTSGDAEKKMDGDDAPIEIVPESVAEGNDGTTSQDSSVVGTEVSSNVKTSLPLSGASEAPVPHLDPNQTKNAQLSGLVEAMMKQQAKTWAKLEKKGLQLDENDSTRTFKYVPCECNANRAHIKAPCAERVVSWGDENDKIRCAEEMSLYTSHRAYKIYQHSIQDGRRKKVGYASFVVNRAWNHLNNYLPVNGGSKNDCSICA